jgi:hypothetical protein
MRQLEGIYRNMFLTHYRWEEGMEHEITSKTAHPLVILQWGPIQGGRNGVDDMIKILINETT